MMGILSYLSVMLGCRVVEIWVCLWCGKVLENLALNNICCVCCKLFCVIDCVVRPKNRIVKPVFIFGEV